MNSVYKCGLFLSGALIVAGGAPVTALAADAPQNQPNATALQEVVVTATRKEEKLQNVPISVTTFSQGQLAAHNIVSAEDLAAYTPSLSAVNFLGDTKTTFGLRGFEQDIGTQPAVGVYFADVVAPRAATVSQTPGDGAGPGSFFDLASTQVLNGPQGTLFGRNTTGGAILLVPNKPTHTFGGYVDTEFGNHDMERIQAVVNLPLADTLAVRVGIDHQTREGYLRNTTGIGPSSFDDVNYTAFRASVLWNITPTIDNYTVFSYTTDQANGTVLKLVSANPLAGFGPLAAAELAAHPGKYTAESLSPNANDGEKVWQVVNTTTWRATSDLTVKNIASYAVLKDDFHEAVFGTDLFPSLPFTNPPLGFVISNPPPNKDDSHQATITEELQVQGRALDHRLDYTAGLYIESAVPIGASSTLAPNFLSCTSAFICSNPVGIGAEALFETHTNFHNYGAYGEATYNFTDQLSLTGGVRYTWDRQYVTGEDVQYNYAPGFMYGPPASSNCINLLPTCTTNIVQKSQAPTGRISLQYKPTQDILLYAKYSRGYRAGGVVIQAPPGLQTFQPEHLNAYEVGMKSSWRGAMPGTFNVAAFYNGLSNQQLSISYNSKPPPFPQVPLETGILNVGSSYTYGVELQASIKPTQSTRIDLNYTYLKTKITKVAGVTVPPGPYASGTPGPLAGDPMENAPAHKVSLTGTYSLPVAEALGDMSIAATLNYSDSQVSSYALRDASNKLTGEDFLSARMLLDLNYNWRHIAGSPVDVSVFANNVLNKYYYALTLPIPGAGLTMAQIGQPRMFGVRLKYSFGQ